MRSGFVLHGDDEDEYPPQASRTRIQPIQKVIEAYFCGEFRQIFDFKLDNTKWTPFQHRVYMLTREIPYGETWTYGDLAKILNSGARAVGRALAALPTSLFVPAHRVIQASGDLGGYRGQEVLKRFLIDLEQQHGKSLRR